MARPTKPQQPESAQLTPEQMERGIARLSKRIADLEAFDPDLISERWHPDVKALEVSIEETLDAVFGHNTIERRRYGPAASLDDGPLMMGGMGPPVDFQSFLREGRASAMALLRQAIKGLGEQLDENAPGLSSQATLAPVERNNKVFIVHGRHAGPKETVARFLDKLGLVPIILHEQPNEGRTVIEKIEAFGGVGFAIVLLTPDDYGALVGEEAQPRARQNVVLELGYFLGKLGRKKVSTLAVGPMEVPSDWRGVIDEPFDDLGRWKMTLAREMRAAGYAIDMNIVVDL